VRAQLADALAVSAAAAVIVLVMGAAVLRAPSERMFGMEIVGRHHDPFTVMQQFERPIALGMYSQPVTDITGALLARVTGPIAAYNLLILLSFPLAAAAAYLLARHLTLSRYAAAVAALAYAFSPFHLAHAAYHPHIAQTQWLPLYLLALWRCLDAATPGAVAFLGLATAAVTLSNFYGGFIAAVITPVALVAYWLVMRPAHRRPNRAVTITVISLVVIVACGLAYVWYAALAVGTNRDAFAVPRRDLFLYSANWWSYLVPPAAHPIVGPAVQRMWATAGVRGGLLEQQVSLGWGVVALAAIAVGSWVRHIRSRHSAGGVRVPVLVAVGVTALLCSLSPERVIGSQIVAAPSALLYAAVPMFRAYARFGVVVQLMAALLAGIGIDFLRRAGSTRATFACAALVALVGVEYVVAPQTLWRDVLPTTAHRWVVRQDRDIRALDCAPLNSKSQSIQWLSGHRVLLSARPGGDCTGPNFSDTLAAGRYTHLLVRRDTAEGRWFANRAASGFRVAADLEDGQVLAVTASNPPIYTAAMPGFFRREHSANGTWRWMAKDAAWSITNTGLHPTVATLEVELWAFRHPRSLELRLDGHHVQNVAVTRARHFYKVGPLTIPAGDHALTFHAAEAPTNGDERSRGGNQRAVSIAVGTWSWIVRGEQE
jgi:hypothetical protein